MFRRHVWSFDLGKTVFVDLSNWREARLNVKTKEQRKDLRLRLRKSRQLQNGFAEGNLPPLLYGGRSKGSFYFHKLFIPEQQCANISLKSKWLQRLILIDIVIAQKWHAYINDSQSVCTKKYISMLRMSHIVGSSFSKLWSLKSWRQIFQKHRHSRSTLFLPWLAPPPPCLAPSGQRISRSG